MKITLIFALFATLTGSLSFPQSLWAQAALDSPQPGSFQSGIGVIYGWVCEAERVDIVFNPGTAHEARLQAAYGTERADTQGRCTDIDNGFGLAFNWNLLEAGQHTVSARADGQEFAQATVTVTTFGKDRLPGVSGEFVVADFPAAGEQTTLAWQEAVQNFVVKGGMRSSGGNGGAPPRVLDSPQPGSFQSGIGVIYGWVCEAERIDIVFNPGTAREARLQAAYGTERADTQGHCQDIDNGFGLAFNWNLLGAGQHTVSVRADGQEFAQATVTVTTFGKDRLEKVGKHARLEDFPDTGTDLIVTWQESLQNFAIARLDNFGPRIASIDAIGDSISKAVNAGECTNGDQENFNWATSITQDGVFCSDGGDGVYSQAERIECRRDTMILNADPNSAESGAEMLKHFFAQAQEAAALFETQPTPRYVTVEMGHNDICSGTIERIQAECAEGDDQDPMNHCRTTPAAFEREFRKGLDELIAVPDLKIGIAAPVRVTQLCNHAAKTNCSILPGSCESLWESDLLLSLRPTGLCGSITIDCSDERRLKDGYETARAYRDIMERVSSEYVALADAETSPVVTVGGETVGGTAKKAAGTSLSFSNASWVYKFTSEQVSCCDCFHPSLQGQDGAARILFDGFTCSPTDVCCADTGDPVSVALCTAEDTSGTFHPGLF